MKIVGTVPSSTSIYNRGPGINATSTRHQVHPSLCLQTELKQIALGDTVVGELQMEAPPNLSWGR